MAKLDSSLTLTNNFKVWNRDKEFKQLMGIEISGQAVVLLNLKGFEGNSHIFNVKLNVSVLI